MAAFYLDENVAVAVALALRTVGHVATTAEDERRLGAPDPLQLLYAADRGWILVTHNRWDIRLLHDASWLLWSHAWGVSQSHSGIIVVEQRRGQTAAELANVLHDLVSDVPPSLASSLHDWKPATGWVRFPAIPL